MNFSEEYLYDNFQKNYKQALDAKARGNLPLAKERFFVAADFMEKLAFVSEGEVKKERFSSAARLKAVAEAIPVVKNSSAYRGGVPRKEENDDADDGAEEMEQFITFYTPDALQCGFEGVIGLNQAKSAIQEYVINPARYPDAYTYRYLDNKAILLEGPPGTGKTTFAKAISKEINQPFALVNVASLVNCYVGETGKNIDKIFAYLRVYAEKHGCGITVFFDELDEIAKKRGSDDKASEAAVPALLRNLDGVRTNKNFLVLANTNRKDALDTAVLERFRKQIYIPLPDEEMRKALFETKFGEVEAEYLNEMDFSAAAEESEGLSGRDIAFICDDIKYYLSEMKAGIREKTDLNEALLSIVREKVAEKSGE